MKRIVEIMSFVLCVFALSTGYAADFLVGVVDTERILRESVPALQAEKKIEKEFEARELDMKKISKQVKELQAYFEKEGKALMDAEHRTKERELGNLTMTLQRLQKEFREDLNLRKNEELASVLALTNKAIKFIAESEKYDLVLQEAVYRNPRIDITDKVLQYLSSAK